MSLTRRLFLSSVAMLPFAAACARPEPIVASAYLTSAQGTAPAPSLPMVLAESAAREATIPSAKQADVDRIVARIRQLMAPIEQDRRAFLAVLADGVAANEIDRAATHAATERIEASADKAAPALRDAIRELHMLLGKTARGKTVGAIERALGTVDDEEAWVEREQFRALAAELELHRGKRWTRLRRGNEDVRRTRAPREEATSLRKALEAFEESDSEEAAWLIVKEATAEAKAWARRMVGIVEGMLVDLDEGERAKLATFLRQSRDTN